MHEGYACSKLLVLSVHQSFSVYLAASVIKICHFMSPAVTTVDSYWTWCVIARERERERGRGGERERERERERAKNTLVFAIHHI